MDCDGRNEGINDIAMEYIASKGGFNVFENPDFLTIFNGVIRPGGLASTREAVELSGLKKGDKVLDVGCGYGLTVELLTEEYGIDARGVDISAKLLEEGKNRNPNLDLTFGDGEMLDFPSLSFDGVFMECMLSLVENQEEAIHEACCLLKKGGKLIISDFFLKEKNARRHYEPKGCSSHSHEHSSCSDCSGCDGENPEGSASSDCSGLGGEEHTQGLEVPLFKSCFEGAFILDELAEMLEDIGFVITHWVDKNKELKEFTASLIMHFGSIEAFFEATSPGGRDESLFTGIDENKKVGYFLLVAEKR